MAIHLVFLFFYLVFGNALSGIWINAVFILQCGMAIFFDKGIRERNEFATPIVVYYLMNAAISAANIHIINITGTSENVIYNYIVPQWIDMSCLIWVIGNTCAFVGYMFVQKKSVARIDYDVSRTTIDRAFIVILAISIFGVQLKHVTASWGSLQKLLLLPSVMGVLVYSRLASRQRSQKYFWYALSIAFVNTLVAIETSYLRAELILPTFIFFLGYFSGQSSVRSFFSLKIVPFLIVFFFFSKMFSALGHYRSNYAVAFQSVFVGDDNEEQDDDNIRDLQQEKTNGLGERLAVIAQLTKVVYLTEKNGFYEGATSAPLLTSLVPRVFWPDKPKIMLGQWFALEAGIAFKNDAGAINNSVNMTIPGELYMDFGFAGVVIGCLIFGMIMALFWNSTGFYGSEYNLIGQIFGGFMLATSLYAISVDLQISITIIANYLVVLLIRTFLPKKKKYETANSRAALARQ